MVMQYLYNGGVDSLEVDQTDVLELMAAANFFQLEGLLRFCEAQCALLVDLDNIVSMYIHAKVFIFGLSLQEKYSDVNFWSLRCTVLVSCSSSARASCCRTWWRY
jgi:hypothetical protein